MDIYDKIYEAFEQQDYIAAHEYIKALQKIDREEAARLLVSLYIEQGDSGAAMKAWEGLYTLLPRDFYTFFLHARILFMEKQYVSAYEELKRIVIPKDKRQGYGEKIANLLGQCCRIMGKTQEASEAYREAAQLADGQFLRAMEYSNYLFNLHYSGRHEADFLRETAANFDSFFNRRYRFVHKTGAAGRPLRIGYISADFRHHVCLCFCYALLTAYDRDNFTVYVYMLGTEDDYSRQLRQQVSEWRNLRGLPAEEAAQVIFEDKIDILVDLAGHTKGNGLSILAYKPAPVQVSGIGYFASTGLGTVDYFLGDVFLDGAKGQPGQSEFTEELLVLSHSHFCYCPLQTVRLAEQSPFCRNGYVTFGSFNNFAKVTDEVLAVWRRILEAVPESRLLLKAAVFDGGEVAAYTKARLARAGLPMDRLECRGLSDDYLTEYGDMDIALDTFPYPGGGTSCDALYMGRPLITLTGKRHGERFGYSLLMNLGLEELAASSVDEYIERAVLLAENPELLQGLQQNIRSMMEKSPLMDRKLYMQDIQAAYRKIAKKNCAEPVALTYREKKQEQNIINMIIRCLDKGDTMSAKENLDKLQQRNALYYYLYSEVAALQEDFVSSDEFCENVLNMPEKKGEWLLGAAYHRLAENARQQGKREQAAAYYLKASRHKEFAQGKAADYSNYLFNLHFRAQSALAMLRAAKGYGEMFADIKKFAHKKHVVHKKLRIGYISPDFCRHIAACFSMAFFSSFDENNFIVYAYADCRPDDVTNYMMKYPVIWRNVYGISVSDKAALIYQDEIDILVDLSGHTGHSALPVLAYKPAPVQISGIGYFATTGLSAVDYFLTDKYAAPCGEDKFFTERLLRLPNSHLCYTSFRQENGSVRMAPCQRNGYVTLGTMNQFDKVTDEMLKLWGEILRQLPSAKLCLKSGVFDKIFRLQEAKRRLCEAGITINRVELQGYTEDYWQFYQQIDIALDTYPYPGGGSTCDALYMGVPVVSMYGQHHHQRFGYSLLKNAGLGDLAVSSAREYIDYVVSLAKDRDLLVRLQKNTAVEFRQSAVMDRAAYMKDLETLYRQIWRDKFGEI